MGRLTEETHDLRLTLLYRMGRPALASVFEPETVC